VDAAAIAEVRRFNRTVSERLGVLRDRYLGRRRPIGEARLLWEAGHDEKRGVELRALRARLGLDSGYLSRLLRALEGEGLVAVEADAVDRRVRRVRLTPKGRRERGVLNRRSDELSAGVLEPLSPRQRERLLAAMAEVDKLLVASMIEIAVEAPTSADARACLTSYFTELDRRFEGGFERDREWPLDVPEFAPPHGSMLVARLRGKPVGCVGLRRLAPGVGEIKRMWVDESLRGAGLGARLLVAIEDEARRRRFGTVRLDTNRALAEAITLYRRHGYVEIARYHHDDAYGDFFFEKRLDPSPRRR
jgi:DNA-binding MarR family transcriptional regulator/GNAT superfamily N-acetyltransferase